MIRITQQNSASGAKRYYATADYYSQGKEIVGKWGGKGAALLGLEGTVDQFSFERLCDNLHPQTGEPLTVRTRTERRVGYDFTFSVPKSVSLLYAMSGDEGILDAFRGEVDETMREIESEMKTRVRRKGKDEDRVTGNMVWAEFIHTTSRPVDGIPDPQLHAHVFCQNATFCDVENRWQAGQFAEIKRDASYFQAAFRVRLANRLQDLGFGIQRKRDDFEIAEIKPDVLKRFSRRTTQIEKVAAEKGITDPKRKAELGAETREKKGQSLSWEKLQKEWDARLSDDERDALAAVHRREKRYVRERNGEEAAVDYAIEHSYVRDAVVPERKIVTEALKRAIGTVTVEDVNREVARRPLIRSEVEGRAMATTQEMLKLESWLIEFARKGRGRCRPLGDPERPITREEFTEGQRAAVRHVLGSRDRVMIIRGGAGTGKTSLEQEIGKALAEAGKPIVALAQSVKASREVLRDEAKFANADTVARFLRDKEMQEAARGGMILVDEASQLGTRDMLHIFEIAESLGSRVLLVGDRKQHRSVSAGEPLRLLEEKAGLRVAEVNEIVRQSGDYEKVSKALSEGRIGEAMAELDELKWIREVPDEERYKELAAAYLSAAAEKQKNGKPKSALVVSPMHSEGKRITEAIRDSLKAQGKLRKERIVDAWIPSHLTDAEKSDPTQYDANDMIQFHNNATGYKKGARVIVGEGTTPPVEFANRFELYHPTQLALAIGDRIRVTAGGKTKDSKHRLNNGSLFTVESFTKHGDIIIDHGWIIDRDFGHMTHGYCVTSHASQGVTVHKVFIGMASESFGTTNERTGYVAITRGKEMAQIFTDDREALLKAVSRPDDPLSATELADAGKEQAGRPMRRMSFVRGVSISGPGPMQPAVITNLTNNRGLDHAG